MRASRRRASARARRDDPRGRGGARALRRDRGKGLALLEALVALALASLLLGALLATATSTARAGGVVGERAEEDGNAALAASLLRFEIESAGRARAAGGLRLVLDPEDAGGDRIEVRYRAEAHRAEPVDVDAAFFAAEDSAGRPNLYRQPRGGRRQPWLLGVTGVHVIAAIDERGRRRPRAELHGATDAAALAVEVRFEDGASERFTALAARAGVVEVARGDAR